MLRGVIRALSAIRASAQEKLSKKTWHNACMPIPKKYAHIDFTPPEHVALEARKGLELRRQFRRGGTMVGVARARDLQNQRTLSPQTIKRMNSFFARHNVDKQGKNFHHPEKPSNGKIAWLLWGGDAGWEWVDSVIGQMKIADGKSWIN